jgi:hypothetical protein
VNVAWPEPFRVPVPRVLGPSLKVTVPVGVPAPGLFTVTVAVNVTDCPNADGLAEELTDVVVPAVFTIWLSVLEVLPLKCVSPPLVAVIECEPAAAVATQNGDWYKRPAAKAGFRISRDALTRQVSPSCCIPRKFASSARR